MMKILKLILLACLVVVVIVWNYLSIVPDYKMIYYKGGEVKKTVVKTKENSRQYSGIKKALKRAVNSTDDYYSLLIMEELINRIKSGECIEIKFEKKFYIWGIHRAMYPLDSVLIDVNGEFKNKFFIGKDGSYYTMIGYYKKQQKLHERLLEKINILTGGKE